MSKCMTKTSKLHSEYKLYIACCAYVPVAIILLGYAMPLVGFPVMINTALTLSYLVKRYGLLPRYADYSCKQFADIRH